jgi:hypothetical protein
MAELRRQLHSCVKPRRDQPEGDAVSVRREHLFCFLLLSAMGTGKERIEHPDALRRCNDLSKPTGMTGF